MTVRPVSEAPHLCVDVAVAGGGLVGASLALALSKLRIRVALIEASPFGAADQPSFDDRTTALSNGSRRVFEGVGRLADHRARSDAHSSHPCFRSGALRLRAHQRRRAGARRVRLRRRQSSHGRSALAAFAGGGRPHRGAGAGQRDDARRRSSAHRVRSRRRRRDIHRGEAGGGRRRRTFHVARSAGVGATTWNYDQVALVSNVFSQRFHNHVAYERFTPSGPIALLPMSEGRLGLIWTLAPDRASEIAELPDDAFLARLQSEFGFRLGRFARVGARQLYPLALTRSDEHVAPRFAVVGNAAQSLHPIAGQGFNLGLRDAASLAEVLADGRAQQRDAFDPGDGLWLEHYREWREADRQNIVRFTDGLVRLFTPAVWSGQAGAQPRHARIRPDANGQGRTVAAFTWRGRQGPAPCSRRAADQE